MSTTPPYHPDDRRYSTAALVRRLVGLAWQFRLECLLTMVLSVVCLVMGLAGLQLLGVVIDVIRHALDPRQHPAGAAGSIGCGSLAGARRPGLRGLD